MTRPGPGRPYFFVRPDAYRGSPVKGRPGLRKIAHRHYLVIYQFNEPQQLVEIVRIWDGRQDPGELALR